jgi:hypothetical protein
VNRKWSLDGLFYLLPLSARILVSFIYYSLVRMSLELSDYEKVRLANIQRNQDYLKSLGIDKCADSVNQVSKHKESASSSDRFRGRRSKVSVTNESDNTLPLPVRRSSRTATVTKIDYKDDHDDFDFPDPIPLVVERTYPALSSEEFDDHSCRVQITAQSLMDFIIVENIGHSEMVKVKVIQTAFVSYYCK